MTPVTRPATSPVAAPVTGAPADVMVEHPVLRFAGGLPGFPAAHDFHLVDAFEGAVGLFLLRSADAAGDATGDSAGNSASSSASSAPVEFVVAAPAVFFPGYAPEIDDVTVERLGLRGAEDALLLVIVTVRDSAANATANLLAPIVVNLRTRAAAQVVLSGNGHSLRAPLAGG